MQKKISCFVENQITLLKRVKLLFWIYTVLLYALQFVTATYLTHRAVPIVQASGEIECLLDGVIVLCFCPISTFHTFLHQGTRWSWDGPGYTRYNDKFWPKNGLITIFGSTQVNITTTNKAWPFINNPICFICIICNSLRGFNHSV